MVCLWRSWDVSSSEKFDFIYLDYTTDWTGVKGAKDLYPLLIWLFVFLSRQNLKLFRQWNNVIELLLFDDLNWYV